MDVCDNMNHESLLLGTARLAALHSNHTVNSLPSLAFSGVAVFRVAVERLHIDAAATRNWCAKGQLAMGSYAVVRSSPPSISEPGTHDVAPARAATTCGWSCGCAAYERGATATYPVSIHNPLPPPLVCNTVAAAQWRSSRSGWGLQI